LYSAIKSEDTEALETQTQVQNTQFVIKGKKYIDEQDAFLTQPIIDEMCRPIDLCTQDDRENYQ